MDVQALQIADRFLALVNISDVEKVTIHHENSYEIAMNHIFETFEISPTLNGAPADPTDIRNIFRIIISLLADAEIENFVPQSAPELTITHHRIENADTQIYFYNYNANFLAVSIDGGEAIFATNRRAVHRLIEFLEEML
jgi:hypothetical protein